MKPERRLSEQSKTSARRRELSHVSSSGFTTFWNHEVREVTHVIESPRPDTEVLNWSAALEPERGLGSASPGQPTMRREAATLCMGVWLMGTVCVSVVAAQDFYTIDRLLANPGNEAFASMVDEIGCGESRSFLRYLASELNRLFFQLWNLSQFGIGAAVLWLVLGIPQASKLKWPVLGMLAVVAFLTIWVTPQVLAVGRNLDFVPREPEPPSLATFRMLHATYTVLEMLKFAVGIVVTAWIFRLPRQAES